MPSTSGKPQPSEPEQSEPSLGVDLWTHGNDSLKVPVAGMLADRPELRDEEHTPSEWDKLLEDYKQSPRP